MYYHRKNESDALKQMDTVSRSNMNRLVKRIGAIKPKLVISTFPICAGYMSKYKKLYDSKIMTATCITDIIDNSEWLYEGTDVYFVATEEIQDALRSKGGVDKSNILVTGIPVKSRFLKLQLKRQLRTRYGYEKRDKIILMMGGGLGLLPDDESFYKSISRSVDNAEVIVITGNNKSLYQKLNKMGLTNLKVLKFTHDVADYMQMSDLLIGKAGGGITLFESIACKIPLIVYKPVLGQELGNCNFIEDKGIGFVTHSEEALQSRIIHIVENSEMSSYLKHRIHHLKESMDMDGLSRRVIGLCNGTWVHDEYLGVI